MKRLIFPALFLTIATVPLLAAGSGSAAENVDPDNDGSQYAYSENAGWLNAEPLGQGGPGIEVGDFALSGYMWGENIGWISLSCDNTSSCRTAAYGVENDGAGVLRGYAWAENAGWISFSCENTSSCGSASYGVTIDPDTGDFAGRAWGENIGWITFASEGPNPFKVKTDWTCAAPQGVLELNVSPFLYFSRIEWAALPTATAYDVIRGDLGTLRTTRGDFAAATGACVVENGTDTFADVPGTPFSGEGFWFLVRGAGCRNGSYDAGQGPPSAPRDPGVLASGNDCL